MGTSSHSDGAEAAPPAIELKQRLDQPEDGDPPLTDRPQQFSEAESNAELEEIRKSSGSNFQLYEFDLQHVKGAVDQSVPNNTSDFVEGKVLNGVPNMEQILAKVEVMATIEEENTNHSNTEVECEPGAQVQQTTSKARKLTQRSQTCSRKIK
ncbi:unnamed protein product [Amaranthus hypochondriacus]